MAYLEDILPQIRDGAKFRRKQWIQAKLSSYVQVVWDNPDYGSCFSDEEGCFESKSICIDWFKYDDWELVSEPVKYKRWLNLYKNGDTAMFASQQDAERAAILLPERQGQLVETREIEWSVQ
jgi:hypothetical protein